jgi:hypothetical protein
MKIKEIFDLSIKLGIEADFRGKERISKNLLRRKKEYEKLSEEKKADFDMEALINPYMDSRIYNIAEDKEIKKVLAGIDIEGEELLLADKMGDIDLTIALTEYKRSAFCRMLARRLFLFLSDLTTKVIGYP